MLARVYRPRLARDLCGVNGWCYLLSSYLLTFFSCLGVSVFFTATLVRTLLSRQFTRHFGLGLGAGLVNGSSFYLRRHLQLTDPLQVPIY
ncbi:hypothetical protein B0H11DRAFT_2122422 [Mycena galericulata]|nr:hypothetical protein B0H11DRAFT_2122422 [Mycena galericulata]